MSQFGNPISGHLIKCLYLQFDPIVSIRLRAQDNSYLIQKRKYQGDDAAFNQCKINPNQFQQKQIKL